MDSVYRLQLTDTETADLFFIGLFSSRVKAEQTGKRYLRTVRGFCEYPCTMQIACMHCLGDIDKTAYYAVGWNETEDGNEADTVESEICSDLQTARELMCKMKRWYVRSHWITNKRTIDICEWTDGFIRVEA